VRPIAIVVAVLAEIWTWRRIVAGRASVWGLLLVVFAAHGVLALALFPVALSPKVGVLPSTLGGAGVGVALYLATRAFVGVAVRWPPFRRHVEDRYRIAARVPLPAALALSLLIAVPGEELFWRGFVQPYLQANMPVLSGPALAWGTYVAVNATSESLPFLAAAIVGGAVWAVLAVWTGGVLAAIVCHAVWTTLMLAWPPIPAREMMPA
jgi:membrane protease YdiL (CAAX protease family)